ncbi:putative inactive leucine-rich repeat receptor-like protein kinase [Iris pallida]|uniref:Inactive leucine-rich repeat receptor-like protein kinase n=1 Tax=Iris pallida TaxID=29817 RepID=A0AAX6F7I3_IRIPA|nr:putative inactive leucine-rich repeat receptor-like protein kinase [Iris pallida]
MSTTMLLLLVLFSAAAALSPSPPASAAGIAPLDDETLGLVAFKSCLADPHGALSAWDAAAAGAAGPCSWPHVQCDASGSRVLRLSLGSLSLSGAPLFRGLDRLPSLESLSLSDNNLSGPLPPGLSLLPRLRVLDLSKNSLSGRLPEDLGSLPSLRSLDLSHNALSGPIPDSLFSGSTCSSLRFLALAANRLEGPIPSALSQCSLLLNLNLSSNQLSGSPDFANLLWPLSRLRALDLSRNALSGPVAEGVAMLHNLKRLHLGGNRFSGPIPAGIGLCPHLDTVDLSGNAFTGAIPYTMQWLSSLSFLSLSDNKLSGDLPAWIGNLTALRHLDLSGNELGGAIPESVGRLKGLHYLSLADNSLAGAIPASLSDCAELAELRLGGNGLNGSVPQGLLDLGLEVLDLSSNRLVGTLPLPESGKLSRTIQSLDLSSNGLSGVVPAEMALFFNLRYLNLSWNGLRSQLPPELGFFRNLSVLDLRRNEFFGRIPGDLCDSGSLAVLQLDENSLSGSIPEEIGNCSSLYLLSLSHNALSGEIPVALSMLKKLEILNLEFNRLSGEVPPQLGMLDNLLAVNISHNRLVGRLPVGGIFRSLDRSALEDNLGICSPLVAEPCKMNVPKPLVIDPNEFNHHGSGGGGSSTDNSVDPPAPRRPMHRRFFSVSTIVAIAAALVIALGVLVVSLLNASARRRLGIMENALESICSSSTRSSSPAVGKTVLFGPKSSLRTGDLVSAESLLSKAIEIGRGAFGTVYKSSIGEGRFVAIKKLLTPDIVQYHEDFDREVRVLAKARHPNLMPIRGYYWTPQLQLLISEFAPGGSLQARLHESVDEPLPWSSRFKIALAAAKGINHLHQSHRPPIIHYSIKPSNILLDEHCDAKVSDFGLARLLPKLDKHVMSSRFQSAAGYVAPELACQSLRVNEKCDVYAYGMVVLELVTGRRPVEYGEDDVAILVDTVRGMLEQGSALDCVDRRMGEFPDEEVLPVMKLGLVCTSQIPSSRPTMAEVVQILQVIKTPTVVEGMEPF